MYGGLDGVGIRRLFIKWKAWPGTNLQLQALLILVPVSIR